MLINLRLKENSFDLHIYKRKKKLYQNIYFKKSKIDERHAHFCANNYWKNAKFKN